jgi:hypothetical protein
MAKKYEKPQSVLYKVLVEKLKEQCANNPLNSNFAHPKQAFYQA